VLLMVIPLGHNEIDAGSLKVLAITLAISVFAYMLSQSLIDRFKDTLCSKGLFGKDLNKAGERDKKEKV
jgi:hypothetical protein